MNWSDLVKDIAGAGGGQMWAGPYNKPLLNLILVINDFKNTSHNSYYDDIIKNNNYSQPIPVATLYKVLGRRPLACWCFIPFGGMDVCRLWLLCIIRYRLLRILWLLDRASLW